MLSSSCRQAPPQAKAEAIIGQDDRDDKVDPAVRRAVGTLHGAGSSALCTAFASSTTEVITAAHCLLRGVDGSEYTFHTAEHGFAPMEKIAYVNYKSDIVIFKAKSETKDFLPLGKLSPDTPASLVGLNFKTLELSSSRKGSIKAGSLKSGTYAHDFDTTPGQSVSPIIQNGSVVAIHVGSSKDKTQNIAVSVDSIQTADVAEAYPEYIPENPIVDALKIAYDTCKGSETCRGYVRDFIVNIIRRVVEFLGEVVDRTFDRIERSAFSDEGGGDGGDRPTHIHDGDGGGHDVTPGGWAGPDVDHGGGGTVVGLRGFELSDATESLGITAAAAILYTSKPRVGTPTQARWRPCRSI